MVLQLALSAPSMVVIDRDNQTRMTTTGHWIVCVATGKNAMLSGEVGPPVGDPGLFEIYDTEEHAKAACDALEDEEYSERADIPAGRQGTVLAVKRGSLHFITSHWKGLCVDEEKTAGAEDPMDVDDDLIGQKVSCFLPFQIQDRRKLKKVLALIGSGEDENFLSLTGSFDGTEVEVQMSREKVKELVKLAADSSSVAVTPEASPFELDVDVCGAAFISMMNRLPASKTVEGDGVCALELLDVTTACVPAAVADVTVQSGVALDEDDDDWQSLTMASGVIGDSIKKFKIDTLGSVPADDSKKMGRALSTLLKAGGRTVKPAAVTPPKGDKFVAAIKAKLAVGTKFAVFVGSSYMLFLEPSLHAWAATQSVSALEGMLGQYLASGGAASSLGALAALPSNMDDDTLACQFLQIVQAVSKAKADAAKAATLPLHNASIASHGISNPGIQQIVIHNESSKAISSDKQRLIDQLQGDANEVMQDKKALAVIDSLRRLRESDNEPMLAKAIDAVDDPRIQRLLSAEGELGSLLRGAHPLLANTLTTMRDVIERKLQKAILVRTADFGTSEKITKSFRAARTGNFNNLRIFWLLDLEDSGTSETPLKELSKWSVDTAIANLTMALSRLERIIQMVWPEVMAEAMTFFPAFIQKLVEYVKLGVDAAALDVWFRSVMYMMGKHSARFRRGGSNIDFTPELDKEWFVRGSDFHDAMQVAVQRAVARQEAASLKGGLVAKRQPRDIEGGDDTPLTKKQKKAAAKKKKEAETKAVAKRDASLSPGKDKPDAGAKWNEGVVYCAKDEEPEINDDGKYLQFLARGHPHLVEFNKNNPRKNDKLVCWAEASFHKGCLNASCPFWHKKPRGKK